MGHSQSTPSALQTCLNSVCAGRSGCVGYPSDLLYQLEWVKPYNLAVDVSPVAVVRPQNAADVAAFVQCAVSNSVSVQAKSGGHSYANFGLGGGSNPGDLAIDLSNLDQFSMDNSTWQATIGPGATLGDITTQLVDNGNRAFAHGVCPGVGLGGHATVGGLGPMSRMWGSCLDHVVEAEVVTADGTLVRASATENSDLFWAIRGAASSFGIVTEFVMRTHPAPGSVVQYSFDFSFGSAADLAEVYSTWQAVIADPNLDRRFGTEFVLYPLGAIITGTFYGTADEWTASGIPARLPQTGNKTIVVNDWLASLTQEAENEALYLSNTQTNFYSKSLGFRREDLLAPAAVVDLFTYVTAANKGTLLWFIIFDASGGAVADVAQNATAFAHRDKVLFYQSYAVDLLSLSTTTRAFLTNFHTTLLNLLPGGNGTTVGTYSGYVDPALAAPQAEYYMTNLPALEVLKAKWDPKQVFHNPQSVQPAA
ncbi:glucooligosaccharide oxidase [Sporothrix brasiliensis 5110]|uniref:Glucooligosaccharide oxidase n=1 Tax=Sporothrix brasiliensis 5110 TaxID=1398154 RepID=A0A0C2ILF7_9PEZI|nr:glucooligosaccharide oxidase [Sporothrix brasiliensis 5110]KIH87835.1 glucooligosaccharide oxidase [Sporothrix brasiliensis 5110]